MTYILNDEGEIVETDEVFTNGRYRVIGNKVVRVGDGTRFPTHYSSSDSMGVQGIRSQADGKYYDSKAEYYKSLKAQGMVVMGNDTPTTKLKQKIKDIDWKQAVAETIKSTPAKGRK